VSTPSTLPTGAEKTLAVRSMFDAVAPRYDLVNRLISMGLAQQWRQRTLDALGLLPPAMLLDLACGTGDFGRLARSSGFDVLGADLSWGMLAANHTGEPVVQADAACLPLPDGCCDGALCGYALRNFTDLAACLAELARVVRPGGRIAFLEVAEPPTWPLRSAHRIWFRHVVPIIGGLFSDAQAYRYLPRSTAYLPDTEGLRACFAAAGFAGVGIRLLHGGLSQIVTATRAGGASS
jgi:demethylmenaquinone methyltransferase/2-methoxy-6-polyprenyl-1,4-benzoquinol methylase